MKIKYLFYKMTHDSGFAPNPFGKYLTLAACTPNHSKSRIDVGDYIIGVESKSLASQRHNINLEKEVEQSIIYIAKINEIKTLNEYFHDKRFDYKKVKHDSTWKEKMGDNVYYCEKQVWKWIRGHQHDWEKEKQKEEQFFHIDKLEYIFRHRYKNGYDSLIQDINGDRVFISEDFMYFGDFCLELKKEFLSLIPNRGTKYNHDMTIESNFIIEIKNLYEKYGYGRHGNPILYKIKELSLNK
ncbi:hypothetical protein NG767_10480 [Aliarcobacter cryaerophilus]|uniref:Nmad2 family putative nucleotide modification protein n=1 Tax=Aliarcobacter cryaerophilus TaxID=28198 RepID=UPI003DA51B69